MWIFIQYVQVLYYQFSRIFPTRSIAGLILQVSIENNSLKLKVKTENTNFWNCSEFYYSINYLNTPTENLPRLTSSRTGKESWLFHDFIKLVQEKYKVLPRMRANRKCILRFSRLIRLEFDQFSFNLCNRCNARICNVQNNLHKKIICKITKQFTLSPHYLCNRSVAFHVSSRDTENDGRLGRPVNIGRSKCRIGYCTL